MVESLGLMWEEERGRCGGADPPPPPPDPPRTPKPLCRAVDHIRSQFQASAGSGHQRRFGIESWDSVARYMGSNLDKAPRGRVDAHDLARPCDVKAAH